MLGESTYVVLSVYRVPFALSTGTTEHRLRNELKRAEDLQGSPETKGLELYDQAIQNHEESAQICQSQTYSYGQGFTLIKTTRFTRSYSRWTRKPSSLKLMPHVDQESGV
jgi:hypothetical protein